MTTEVQWSELQRDPKSVAALAEQGEVRVRRRDGVDLLLVREDRAESAMGGALTAARAVRALISHAGPAIAADALVDEFPWITILPDQDRVQFLLDFTHAFQASADLGQWSLLDSTVREWKATAAIYTDPALCAGLSGSVTGDHGRIPTPQEA